MADIKFLVTGDLHWRGNNPKARVDDYKLALTNKLHDIQELASEHQVNGVIIPGDIFDSPGASLPIIADLMLILRGFPVPTYTIGGNHDWYGGTPVSEHRTPYGILSRSGLIKNIDEIVFPGKGIVLQGHSYYAEITDKNISYYLPHYSDFYDDKPRVNVLVTHGMLLEKSPGYEIRHTLMSDVAAHPNAPDILINGHEHQGFGIKKINNTLFINPGSIGRIKATEENINRVPQVALLTIPEDGEPYAELIPLKSAKPGHEVLSREHIIEEKKRKEMTKEFLTLLAEEGESRYQDLEQIVKGIGERKNIAPNIIKEALRRLAEAREEGHNERRAG